MATPSSAGRTHRRWKEHIRPAVLAESQICYWCGHPGADTVDHILPRSLYPQLAHDPANLAPMHGTHGCPYCPVRLGKRRVCQGEKGNRVGVKPPDNGSRPW